jgi:hypothetical protein
VAAAQRARNDTVTVRGRRYAYIGVRARLFVGYLVAPAISGGVTSNCERDGLIELAKALFPTPKSSQIPRRRVNWRDE